VLEILQIRSASSSPSDPAATQFLRDNDRVFSEIDRQSTSAVSLEEAMWPLLNSRPYMIVLTGPGTCPQGREISSGIAECLVIGGTSPVTYAVSTAFPLPQLAEIWNGVLEATLSVGAASTNAATISYGLTGEAPRGLFAGASALALSSGRFSTAFATEGHQFRAAFDRNRMELKESVLRLFAEEPLEIGYTHPVEHVLRDSFAAYGFLSSNWIGELIRENDNRPSIVAAILTCLGRLERKTISSWADTHVRKALLHRDVEVRESAVRAIEMWNASDFLMDLKRVIRREKVSWMVDYIREVVSEIER
jgi:hypothetical protein